MVGSELTATWSPLSEVPGVDSARAQGMIWAGERHQPVVEEIEHPDIRRRQVHLLDVDGEMRAPLTQRLDHLGALPRRPADPHRRRDLLEPVPQRLHDPQLPGFGGDDGEIALGVARIEGLGRPEQALHAGKDHVHGRSKLDRFRRRHQLLARPHEQLVGEDLAELGQRMANGRGAPPKPLGGAGHARVDEQGVEDHEQVGVDLF